VTDTVTAAAGLEPTAIEPSRVVILDDAEQRAIIDAYANLPDGFVPPVLKRLVDRIAFGDEYVNETDELVRTTLRKRRLEAETRRCNIRIENLEEAVVEQLLERGDTGGKHAGTGASYRLDSKVWAKLDVDVDGLPKDQADEVKARVKAQAGDALIAAGLGDFVRSDFNLNTVSAYFREQVKAWRAEQQDLPERERAPRDISEFLPDELRGLLRLDDKPTITVRA
jgi:hypothetical protein